MNENIYSYCGYDCKECPIYKATISNDIETLKRIYFIGPDKECSIETHGCKGCKSDLKNHMCDTCFIKNCNIEKKITNCAHCEEYPCGYLKNYISVQTRETLDKIHKELKGEDLWLII